MFSHNCHYLSKKYSNIISDNIGDNIKKSLATILNYI